MIIEAKDLVEEYYEQIKDEYPELNKVREACRFPFKFTREKIIEGELKDIRFKYFGSFKVFVPPVVAAWDALAMNFIMSEENREKKRENIYKYVMVNLDRFSKQKRLLKELEEWKKK